MPKGILSTIYKSGFEVPEKEIKKKLIEFSLE